MDKHKKEALEAAGWQFGDYGDFLGLTPEERQAVELRLAVSRRIRELRKRAKLTQQQVASRMNSTQPKVAKIEAAAGGVSLDMMFNALFAVGGSVKDLALRMSRRQASKPAIGRAKVKSPSR